MNAKAGGLFVLAFVALGAGQAVFGFFDRQAYSTGAGGGENVTYNNVASGGRASEKQLQEWITQALVVMKEQGIPGSRAGIRKIMHNESGGDPNIVNDWDENADNGVPSQGLMQVIPPTFKAHHCPGTSWNIKDPVANICAASHYAWKRYGSIDVAPTPY
jgi:soluble lytic murein transglycosylase-like protein